MMRYIGFILLCGKGIPIALLAQLIFKTARSFIMCCLACISMTGYSVAHAQENDGSIFFEGRIANSESLLYCSGTCSADPSGTLGMGFAGDEFDTLATLTFRPAISLDYSRSRFIVNGNTIDVAEKGIHLHLEWALKSLPEYVFSVRGGLGWISSSSMNSPGRTVFSGGSGIDLIYRIVPDLSVLVGVSSLPVVSSNLADFYSRTVDVGLRWYL